MSRGQPIHGIVHATTLTTAVLVPIYNAGAPSTGGATAITPAANQKIHITDIYFISNTAADIHIFLSDDNDATAEVGETVLRGTVAANGGVSKTYEIEPRVGAAGADVRVSSSSSATVDVVFTGFLTNV